MIRDEIEILAPAGDYETLRAAIDAGADAVYVGGEKFGARAYAVNFSQEELLSAIDYVHLYGKKIYLTVNTLVKECEFGEIYDYLLPYYKRGLDAVIVQDVGVMEYIRRQFPGLSVHASTQMTVTHAVSAQFLESLGVERIVPARELSLREIRRIREKTSLEIECFVHGALCYCYSGQCLLSSMIGGRSGNRGQCAQPCRLPYRVEKEKRPQDILSLKDLCTIEMIPDLIESGITSFKIEGRMKQPAYVSLVTRMYRKYVDLYMREGRKRFRVSEADLQLLQSAYQRRGYCDGYYKRHNGKEMLSLVRPKQENQREQTLVPQKKIEISGSVYFTPGEPMVLLLNGQGQEVCVTGACAQEAAKQPASAERVEKQMRKTGNTPFVFEEFHTEISGNVFVPVQALNELRRNGLDALERAIVSACYRDEPDRREPVHLPEDRITCGAVCDPIESSGGSALKETEFRSEPHGEILTTVSVETISQLETVSAYPFVSIIYVEDALWADVKERERLKNILSRAEQSGKRVYFAMARIFREEAERFYEREFAALSECFHGVLVRNMESLLYVRQSGCELPVVMDASAYAWNGYAKRFWNSLGAARLTAPVELNARELKELDIRQMEFTVYGYQPVMVSAGCIKKHTERCDRVPGIRSLTDRYQNKNKVKNECVFCYNIIYNSIPLMLFDQTEEIARLNPKAIRLQFSTESGDEARQMMDLYQEIAIRRNNRSTDSLGYTRGHFRRGVR